MTEQDSEPDDQEKSWWQGEGMPDIEALLGEEGMEAVGTVADEALKLFVSVRERFATEAQSPAGSEADPSAAPSPWGSLFEQVATTAIQAVNELAAAGAQLGTPDTQPLGTSGAPAGDDAPVAEGTAASEEHVVLPGQAAACSYCPVCQTIALFRSVPMSTWQRLAASIVEVADAAREFTGNGAPTTAPIVVTPQSAPAQSPPVTVDDVLAGIVEPDQADVEELADSPDADVEDGQD